MRKAEKTIRKTQRKRTRKVKETAKKRQSKPPRKLSVNIGDWVDSRGTGKRSIREKTRKKPITRRGQHPRKSEETTTNTKRQGNANKTFHNIGDWDKKTTTKKAKETNKNNFPSTSATGCTSLEGATRTHPTRHRQGTDAKRWRSAAKKSAGAALGEAKELEKTVNPSQEGSHGAQTKSSQ